MKKKSITLIIGLMGSALLGVLAMQLYFLVQTYQMQSKQFDSTVYQALDNVVGKIAKQDAINFITLRNTRTVSARINSNDLKSTVTFERGSDYNNSDPERGRRRRFVRDSLKNESKRLAAELAYPDQQGSFSIKWHFETYTDEYGYTHQQRMPEFEITPLNGDALKQHKLRRYDTLHYDYVDAQLGRQVVNVIQENPFWKADQEHKQKLRQLRNITKILKQDSIQSEKEGKSHTMFANIADEYQKSGEPLRMRLNPMLIDSLLRFEFQSKGITLPFSYEVTNANNDSLIFSKAMDVSGVKPQFIQADYQKPIFEKEVINDPGMLWVKFPQKNSLILSNMAFSMATSGGLLLVLIFCFGYTIFSILRQKKISEMKTDFINNMTHEFKTPVSTIMIASEALKDEEVTSDKARISRLANIIYEENARLGSHIERVLNIARIEKNDFKLDIKPVDVNEQIAAVIDSMSLKMQKYGASITQHLDATDAVIEADELHFSNVIYNLIDNALKYSHDAPEITISTFNNGNQIGIVVADKGIGMSRDQQIRIFEQFYRVPTGNLHDVKGFGLGLSYVNTIVKRLEGLISVRSEKEKGSEFELRFPLA